MSSRPDLPGQTSLRGIAAMTVFIYHARFDRLFPQFPTVREGYNIFAWTENAVDLFFQLSGFILCYVYLKNQIRWKHYALARFGRIYPAFLVTFLFFLSLNFLSFLKSGIFTSQTTWPIVITNLLLVQRWFLPPFYSLNEPTWSISVEAFLYIFIFPTLCFVQKFLKTGFKAVLVVLPVAILCALYAQGYHSTAENGFLPPLRGILCFTSGFFLCQVGLEWKFQGFPRKLEFALLPLVCAGLLFSFGRNWADLLLLPLVYCTANAASLSTRLLNVPLLCWIGDLSYSIYLWHWPLIKALGVLLGMRQIGGNQFRHDSIPHNLLYIVVLVGLTLAISHLSHYCFEMPLVRWFRRWGDKRTPGAPPLAAANPNRGA